MSAADALKKFYERQMKRDQPKVRRRNARPEFEVKKAVLTWLKVNGFSCNVIEAKAVFSVAAGRYTRGQTSPGVSDLFGCAPNGIGCFIELKAPGRISTLSEAQRVFLMEKINLGCFALVVDSVDCLENAWKEFQRRRGMSQDLARVFLVNILPRERAP